MYSAPRSWQLPDGRCTGALLWLAATLALAAFPATARNDSPFSTVATVNDDVITRYEVEQHALLDSYESGRERSAEADALILEQLIDLRLVEREAAARNIEVSEAEIDNWLELTARRSGISYARLLEEYEQVGIFEQPLRDAAASQMLRQRLAQDLFGARILQEIDPDALARRVSAYENDQRVAHLLFRINLGVMDDTERVQRLWSDIRDRVEAGESFAALARRISRSADAERGGNLGFREEAQLTPALVQIIRSTPVGSVTAPLRDETDETVILFRADTQVLTHDGVRPWLYDIEELFLAVPEGADLSAVRALADRAAEAGAQVEGCGSALPEGTGIGRRVLADRSLADIAPELRPWIRRAEPGAISEPSASPAEVWITMLCSREGGIVAEFRDSLAEVLAYEVEAVRMNQLWDAYIADLRSRATILRKEL